MAALEGETTDDTSGLVATPKISPSVISPEVEKQVKTALAMLDQLGDYWKRRGLVNGLASLGLFAAGLAIGLKAVGESHWDDFDVVVCLAFAILVLVLAAVTGIERSRQKARQEDRGVKIFEIEANAQVAMYGKASGAVGAAAGRARGGPVRGGKGGQDL